ncbi:MAG: adenine deaminase [Sulfolobales archaeon]
MALERTLRNRSSDVISEIRKLRYSLEFLRELILASRGFIKSDIIIEGTRIVNTASGEILENVSIALYRGFIIRIISKKDYSMYKGDNTIILDGRDLYAIPGFIDAHVHIESSLLSPEEFSKLAIAHGTTLVVADPHEIVNVGGVEALKHYFRLSTSTPLKILLQVPSCVPPVDPSLEIDSPGAVLGEKDLEDLISDQMFHSLGEYMDYYSVINASDRSIRSIASTHRAGKIIYGHIPSSDEEALDPYIVTGISSCHESTYYEEALEKLRRGMYVMIREGSSWRDLDLAVDLYRKGISLNRVILVSDDISIVDLYEKGYMDYIARESIERGIDPINVFKMITLNPATYLRIDDLFGLIAPGRVADIVLLRNLEKVYIDTVIVDGKILFRRGILNLQEDSEDRISTSCNTMCRKIGEGVSKITPSDLIIRTNARRGHARVNVIKVITGKTVTLKEEEILPIEENFIRADPSRDILHVAVIDRYRDEKIVGRGFVKGLGIKRGALAQTIAHDTHNIIVVGSDPGDMFAAVREIVKSGGGMILVVDGEVVARVDLEGYGLFSTSNYENVYRKMKNLEKKLISLGAAEERIYMTLSLIPLPVIPEIRLTPRGLVDVRSLRLIDVVAEILPKTGDIS